jgi:hypothetical protein
MVAACSEGDDSTGDQGSTTTATTAAPTVRVVSQNLLLQASEDPGQRHDQGLLARSEGLEPPTF